jgi:hypothetical protein
MPKTKNPEALLRGRVCWLLSPAIDPVYPVITVIMAITVTATRTDCVVVRLIVFGVNIFTVVLS